MPTLEFETQVAAPLDTVWNWHQDPHNLPRLSPPAMEVRIESVDLPLRRGSRLALVMKGPLGRQVRWVAKIVEQHPPHDVVFGREARWIDEQESGPFRRWTHSHEFERLDPKTTRVLDRVTYRMPLGPLGWLADVALLRRQIRDSFDYRHRQLWQLLEQT